MASAQTVHAAAQQRCRVLLADDDAASLLIARITLESAGMDVATATTGLQALQLAITGKYDVVVLDVHMPELTGVEVTRRIRRDEADRGLRRIPIIALTASAFPHEQRECREAGMNDVVIKPYELEQLADTIKRWCEAAS